VRGRLLRASEKRFNTLIQKRRFRVEHCFGTKPRQSHNQTTGTLSPTVQTAAQKPWSNRRRMRKIIRYADVFENPGPPLPRKRRGLKAKDKG
jgi:hypothetical protein